MYLSIYMYNLPTSYQVVTFMQRKLKRVKGRSMGVLKRQHSSSKIPTIYECESKEGENRTVVADMDGTLLIERSSFPYFALVAFDVGGIPRLLLLLLAAPLAALLYHLVSESAGIKVLIFTTFAGVKVSSIKSAATAVLPKHYSEDLHPETWRVFSSCGRKCVLTANPRIMVEPFLKNYLGVDLVLGTEISSYKGFATGFVAAPGVLVGKNKAVALRKAFRADDMQERYVVPPREGVQPVRPDSLPKAVIFHDGRLVQKPTPLMALLLILWFPIGILLSILRIFIGAAVPISTLSKVLNLIGCPVIIKGSPHLSNLQTGKVSFLCYHTGRSLMRCWSQLASAA